MKSNFAVTAVKKSVVWANRWSAFPIQWNEAESKAEVNESQIKWILWGLSNILEAANMIYLIAKAIEMHITESTDLRGKTMVEFLIVAYSIKLCSLQGFFCTQPQKLVDFINMGLVSHGKMNEGKRLEVGKTCELFIRGLYSLYVLPWTAFSLGALIEPHNPAYITSLTQNLWLKAPLFVLHVYFIKNWWCCVDLLFIPVAIHIFASVTTMNRIKSKALTVENVHRTYSNLRVLQERCNATYAWPLAFMKMSWVMTALRNLHAMLRGGGFIIRAQQMNAFVCTMTFLEVVFKAMGKFHDTSEEFLFVSMRLRGDAWFRRFHRSCTPLKVDIGNMYYVDRGMTLNLYTFLIQNTVALLIAD